MANVDYKIDEIYSENNYPGLEKLLKLVKAKYPEITRDEVKQFRDKEVSAQLLKVTKKRKAATSPTSSATASTTSTTW